MKQVDCWYDSFFGFHQWPSKINFFGVCGKIMTFEQKISRYAWALDVYALSDHFKIKIERITDSNNRISNEDILEKYLTLLSKKYAKRN